MEAALLTNVDPLTKLSAATLSFSQEFQRHSAPSYEIISEHLLTRLSATSLSRDIRGQALLVDLMIFKNNTEAHIHSLLDISNIPRLLNIWCPLATIT